MINYRIFKTQAGSESQVGDIKLNLTNLALVSRCQGMKKHILTKSQLLDSQNHDAISIGDSACVSNSKAFEMRQHKRGWTDV